MLKKLFTLLLFYDNIKTDRKGETDMKTTITQELTIDKPIFIQSKSGDIYKITEGTGDSLALEDIENGFIDYIYYDIYVSLEDLNEDIAFDGGLILLKKLYKDHTVEEIISKVMGD